jgi:NurA-like 5'-3' nuclease
VVKILDGKIGGDKKYKLDRRDLLIDKIADDQKLLMKYYKTKEEFRDEILKHIKDEDFLIENSGIKHINHKMLEKYQEARKPL